MSHEHVMSTADQERAHSLKNEFLDLCLNRKVSTLVALSAARCAAECFESIINEQGGEVFTAHSPSDFEQLAALRILFDKIVSDLEMRTCYGCNNRIGWNETPTKYGDWTKCSSCRNARELLKQVAALRPLSIRPCCLVG